MLLSISSTGIRRVSNFLSRSNLVQNKSYLSCLASNKVYTSKRTDINRISSRGLYCKETLGLDKINSVRESKLILYQNHKEKYIERLESYLNSGEAQSILRDDLANMIGLADNDRHFDLIERIVTVMKKDANHFLLGWGTGLMRLYYLNNQVDRAYKNLKDTEAFGDFFNEYTSYRIALTMFYEAGKYDEAVEIYELALQRLTSSSGSHRFPGLAMVAFASLAKLNSPEALEKAEKLYGDIDIRELTSFMRMRIITFMVYMANNQNQPALALNLISDAPSKNYVTMRELKTISLLKLKRYEDIIYHLREYINRYSEFPDKNAVSFQEVYDLINSKLNEVEDEDVKQNLSDILAEIKQKKLVQDQPLEALVFAPVKQRTSRPMDQNGQQDALDRRGGQRSMDRPIDYKNNNMNDRNNFDQSRQRRYSSDFPTSRRFNNNTGGYNNRQQRGRGKSYFEEDPEQMFDDEDEDVQGGKR